MAKKNMIYVEYLWLDGKQPTQDVRSKTRLLPCDISDESINLDFFPDWSFDGSSTNQAQGGSSDLILKPVAFCKDPLRPEGSYLVLCEVFLPNGEPHPTNGREKLRTVLKNKQVSAEDIWIGFEQEYTFLKGGRPLGWPKHGRPEPQGPYYCGVGTTKTFGRDIVEEHMYVCQEAGLCIYGINAEVMPAQWEFQIGYRGNNKEVPSPLLVSDHMWIARWFLHRIAEDYDVIVSLHNKPIEGDWNGAGMHTNFSTKKMRAERGLKVIEQAIQTLSNCHQEHIVVYGDGLEKRLTGAHETCAIDEFSSGVANRGSAIRIPSHVKSQGSGYFEDRRPGANGNPYTIARRLICSIFEYPFS